VSDDLIGQASKWLCTNLFYSSLAAEKRKAQRKSDDGFGSTQGKVDSQQVQQTDFESVYLTLLLLHIRLLWSFCGVVVASY
jgi:hypothetical protein